MYIMYIHDTYTKIMTIYVCPWKQMWILQLSKRPRYGESLSCDSDLEVKIPRSALRAEGGSAQVL